MARTGLHMESKRNLSCTLPAVALALLGVACSTPPPDAPPPPEFEPTATIQDIMLEMVDPAADTIWESVATIITFEGTEERRPSTDEDWAKLRREAVILVEASNLLMMDGRRVAASGFKSENPGIELEPGEIESLIADDRATWNRLSHALYESALIMLQGVDAQDPDMLFDNGGPLDQACEGCHRHYWYPQDRALDLIRNREASEKASVEAPAAEDVATIQGRVRLDGKLPGNRVIRMGVDPKCKDLNAGRTVVQETVAATIDGSLANVFVTLEGSYPETPVPTDPVVVDQVRCLYRPRVVGARVGQTVRFLNSDPLYHNVHSLSATTNAFNIGQPIVGTASDAQLEEEGGMLRIKCDVHRWMTLYLGVVDHPYFAVSDTDGLFTIEGVPAGDHTVEAWHEVYGVVSQTVTVVAGETATVDFTFAGEAA